MSRRPAAVVPRPGEFELIARHFAPLAAEGGLGLLDDAAALAPPPGHDLVLTCDALVAGVHFFADDPPGAIARKALRVNLSDLAAKGAAPLGFLLTLGLPPALDEPFVAAFAEALGQDGADFGCPLYGGDTVKAPGGLFLSITIFGAVPQGRMVRRMAGEPGDVIYVSGTIGDAALGLQARLNPEAAWLRAIAPAHRAHLLDRYLHPQPRTALAPAVLAHARAAMDVSDGLIGDCAKLGAGARLGRLCRVADVPLSEAARAALEFAPALRETVLTGGDDYEILAAVPVEAAPAFEAAAAEAGVPVTTIGELGVAGAPHRWIDESGRDVTFARQSFTHF